MLKKNKISLVVGFFVFSTLGLGLNVSAVQAAGRWIDVGAVGFSDRKIENTSIAFDTVKNEPYVLYTETDDAGNDKKISVKKFNGSEWKVVDHERYNGPNVGSSYKAEGS